jgi:hypothetical protein
VLLQEALKRLWQLDDLIRRSEAMSLEPDFDPREWMDGNEQ